MIKQYVLGFLFSLDRSKVVLIKKNRPKWQAGYLNGIGGKMESTDWSKNTAMVREFKEEGGVQSEVDDWKEFAQMHFKNDVLGGEAIVYCFSWFSDQIYQCRTMESEEIILVSLDGPKTIELPLMENVPMLIEIALNESLDFCEIKFN